jgi:hypothetical protein
MWAQLMHVVLDIRNGDPERSSKQGSDVDLIGLDLGIEGLETGPRPPGHEKTLRRLNGLHSSRHRIPLKRVGLDLWSVVRNSLAHGLCSKSQADLERQQQTTCPTQSGRLTLTVPEKSTPCGQNRLLFVFAGSLQPLPRQNPS